MTPTKPVLVIPDEAKRALAGKPQPVQPPHPAIKRACEYVMRRRAFGERMEPTFKVRLLQYSSFTALARAMP